MGQALLPKGVSALAISLSAWQNPWPCVPLEMRMSSCALPLPASQSLVAHVLQLSKAVVALEAALRPVALVPDWRAGESAGAGARTPATSQAVSRAVSVADLASGAGALCSALFTRAFAP